MSIPSSSHPPAFKSENLLLFLLGACIAALTSGAAEAPSPIPKPFVVVEAWHDRDFCSDLYAYNFEGKLLRKLTEKPLPSCSLAAVSLDGGQVTFVANASALYDLNIGWNSLVALHGGDASAVSISRDGKGVAYAARGFQKEAGQFLYVQPLVAGAPFERLQIPITAQPREITFTPDGTQLLLSNLSGDCTHIDTCELKTGEMQPWLSDPKWSYSQPTFSADGKTVAVIAEDLQAGQWAIVSTTWPPGELKTLRTGPVGLPLYSPAFTSDGQYLLFFQAGVLARMPAAGGEAEGLTGELDNRPNKSLLIERIRQIRPASSPLLIDQWFATVQHREANGVLELVNVHSKEKKLVPLPKGKLQRAVVIE